MRVCAWQSLLCEQDIRNLVNNVSSASYSLNPDVFGDLHQAAFDLLLHDFFTEFKESPEYNAYMAKIAEHSARERSGSVVQQRVNLKQAEADRAELGEMLSQQQVRHFKKHLEKNADVANLLFYYEVEDFKNIPPTQATFVQARAHKVGG